MAATSRVHSRIWDDVCTGAAPSSGAHGADADFAWAASGAMTLTGEAAGPPLLAPAPLAWAAAIAVENLRSLAWRVVPLDLDAARLLGERAACFGFAARRGERAAGAQCRLMPAADGWLAVHLAREEDLASLPAWLETALPRAAAGSDPWCQIAAAVARRSEGELVERARLLGLPVAPASDPPKQPRRWCRVTPLSASRDLGRAPRVMDLTALWAGPLCTHLLERAGADVVKVESLARPDGARRGDATFYKLLNYGKRSVALDFSSAEGLRALRRLFDWADIVVESARPRALAQLGFSAEGWVSAQPGRTWVGITGYGRAAPQRDWVAFGDDASAAGGLCRATGSVNRPVFCGDAIADPLAGLHAAVAALASARTGGGHLIDVALADVIAHWVAQPSGTRVARVGSADGADFVEHAGERVAVSAPQARTALGDAAVLGADTKEVLAAC